MGTRRCEDPNRRKFCRDRAISSRDLGSAAAKTETCSKCLATSGNGPAAPIRPIPVIAPRPARSANTTASSCATNTCCAAAPAPLPHSHPHDLSEFLPTRKTLAVHRDPSGSRSLMNGATMHLCGLEPPRKQNFRAEVIARPLEVSAHIALQIFLRRARRGFVPANLRAARVLHHPHRDGDSASARRGNGERTRAAASN